MNTPVWTVTLTFDEDDAGLSWARAVLHSAGDITAGPGEELVAEGRAVRWPGHEEVPAIGRQWAAARALAELGRRLGDHAFADVAANALDRPALGRDPAGAPGRVGR